jgi:hypothetical protein
MLPANLCLQNFVVYIRKPKQLMSQEKAFKFVHWQKDKMKQPSSEKKQSFSWLD